MSILVVSGINYHRTPLEERQELAMPKHCILPALQRLNAEPGVAECAILSTCNRTEIYAVADSAERGLRAIEQFFLAASSRHGRTIRPDFKLLQEDAALQLFRVASGLDSMVVGEGQILGQVKQALELAQEAGTSGSRLNKLFSFAIACGKRVRTETRMSHRAVSVASAAVELAREPYGTLRNKNALVVGAGTMGALCEKHLSNKSNRANTTVVTRCDDENLRRLIDSSEIIFVATSAQEFVLGPEHIKANDTTKYFFDLSVPRNVNPEIAKLPNVILFSIDDLQSVVRKNLEERQRIATEAEPIVFETLNRYKNWLIAHSSSQLITKLQKNIHQRQFLHQATINLRRGRGVDELTQIFNLVETKSS
jgi:glutamyl-tRNA reductase